MRTTESTATRSAGGMPVSGLLIVESKAKARTIHKYLGKDWLVMACRGHVRRLPEAYESNQAYWTNSADQLPKPPWGWTENGEQVVSAILAAARDHGVREIYIATDPDREGELIAWHFCQILRSAGYKCLHRITFNEISESAVRAAIARGGSVNSRLVDAALVRTFIDRLVGFRCSRFSRSWRLKRMGRVQTPALGFVVDRELEREAFVPKPYCEVRASAGGVGFSVHFCKDRSASGAWIDDKGRFDPTRTGDREVAEAARTMLAKRGRIRLNDVAARVRRTNPRPPFTTDTLLLEAGKLLGWSTRRTTAIAQALYSAGQVTYIRTDSTRISEDARTAMREHVCDRYGEAFVRVCAVGEAKPSRISPAPKSEARVQDAHEAIRPVRPEVESPEGLNDAQLHLYQLIWARFAGSEMSPALYEHRTVRAEVDGLARALVGTIEWRTHAGWEAAYERFNPSRPHGPPSLELAVGAVIPLDVRADSPQMVEGHTKPPPRLTEHGLVQRMKKEGIGRPSTYAATIEKLKEQYVSAEGGSLAPTNDGRTAWLEVTPCFEGPDGWGLLTCELTARIENSLDAIGRGEVAAPRVWNRFLDEFRVLYDQALERRRRRPTARQLDRFCRLTSRMSDTERHELTGGRHPESLAGGEMQALLKTVAERLGPGGEPPSAKQLELIRKRALRGGLAEREACALVNCERFEQLSGGRSGTASRLIEQLPDPATEAQRALIATLCDRLGLAQADACTRVAAGRIEELTTGAAAKLIKDLFKTKKMKTAVRSEPPQTGREV